MKLLLLIVTSLLTTNLFAATTCDLNVKTLLDAHPKVQDLALNILEAKGYTATLDKTVTQKLDLVAINGKTRNYNRECNELEITVTARVTETKERYHLLRGLEEVTTVLDEKIGTTILVPSGCGKNILKEVMSATEEVLSGLKSCTK